MNIEPIGHVESPYPTKFGVPRQPGLVRGLLSWLVFDGEVKGPSLEAAAGSYLWLLWDFSENHRGNRPWSPTVRPPRLGGNRRVGVFASRSSFRPNNLAISAVEVADAPQERGIPLVGADLVDGTPVYAVRPYDASRDRILRARAGWLADEGWPVLSGVEFEQGLEERIPPELRRGVRELLVQDPRPAYTRRTQPDRAFWVPVGRQVLTFEVREGTVVVTAVRDLSAGEYDRLKREGTLE